MLPKLFIRENSDLNDLNNFGSISACGFQYPVLTVLFVRILKFFRKIEYASIIFKIFQPTHVNIFHCFRSTSLTLSHCVIAKETLNARIRINNIKLPLPAFHLKLVSNEMQTISYM